MKKEIVEINEEKKIFRVTTVDERWYARPSTDPATGLPSYEFRPSASWIAGKYPKGIGYFKWLAEKGWDEAEAIKLERAQAGSKMHQACEQLALGNAVKHDDKFTNPETGAVEELTVEEYEAVISFKDWYESIAAMHPVVVATEFTIWADKYAGTGDLLIEVDRDDMPGEREIWLIDLKSSQNVFESHKIQLNMYFRAPIMIPLKGEDLGKEIEVVPTRMFILQIGYRRNKNAYKFTEVEKDNEMWQDAYRIWKREHGEEQPKQRDLPLAIEGIKKPEPEKTETEKLKVAKKINKAE